MSENLSQIVFRPNAALVERWFNTIRDKILVDDWSPVVIDVSPIPTALIQRYRQQLNAPEYVGDDVELRLECRNTNCDCYESCHCTTVNRLTLTAVVRPVTKACYLEL